jgi:hypothetical protein
MASQSGQMIMVWIECARAPMKEHSRAMMLHVCRVHDSYSTCEMDCRSGPRTMGGSGCNVGFESILGIFRGAARPAAIAASEPRLGWMAERSRRGGDAIGSSTDADSECERMRPACGGVIAEDGGSGSTIERGVLDEEGLRDRLALSSESRIEGCTTLVLAGSLRAAEVSSAGVMVRCIAASTVGGRDSDRREREEGERHTTNEGRSRGVRTLALGLRGGDAESPFASPSTIFCLMDSSSSVDDSTPTVALLRAQANRGQHLRSRTASMHASSTASTIASTLELCVSCSESNTIACDCESGAE